MKLITFAVPCYNSAAYMDHCIQTLLAAGDEAEIILVDDGSTENTPAIADRYQEQYPEIVRVIHQPNGGHGEGVNQGMRNAQGLYYKVVDSDDWLDAEALTLLMAKLRHFIEFDTRVDLVITNYVYEHVEDGKQTVIDYRYVLPRNKIFTWSKAGHFNMTQNLLMHALCYRTDVLRDGGVPMPPHTFYVDNIYAYVPLPRCKTIYYLDVDLYRYFIGREDQSVNERVMISRIDQQLRVTRIMMRAYHLYEDVEEPKLRSYMIDYLTLMMAVSSIFSKLSDAEDAMDNLNDLWEELKSFDVRMYRRARMGMVGLATTLPGEWGKRATIGIYHVAQKLVKFN